MYNFDLLSTAQAALRLGVTRQGVLDMVVRGAITPTGKLAASNGTYLFAPAEVERVAALREQREVAS